MDPIRAAFPLLANTPELVYLDSAATALKPTTVIEALESYYRAYPANIHRGFYPLAARATEAYEHTRTHLAHWIDAASSSEIVFTKGATEAINLIASITQAAYFTQGSEVLVSSMEHHANFVPWQTAAHKTGAEFKVLELDWLNITPIALLEAISKSVTERTRIVALTACSNVLGMMLPVEEMALAIKKKNPNTLVIIDASQYVVHHAISVRTWGCDFAVFSGHKLYGPTGVGVLYGKQKLLETLPPYQTGGDMIDEVTLTKTTFAQPPHKYEAGTPPIASAIALSQAISFVQTVAYPAQERLADLHQYARTRLREVFTDKVHIYENTHFPNAGILAFTLEGVHPHDIAQLLGEANICIRAGHHCAQPLHNVLQLSASCRLSLGVYNTESDIDAFIAALQKAMMTFQK